MHVDTNKLKGKIVERGMTHEKLALEIGINPSTFYRKMLSEGVAFSVGEMHKMAEALDLTADEASNIFLAQNSQ